jgi:hypothetical protein
MPADRKLGKERLQAWHKTMCTHISVAQLVLAIGSDARDSCGSHRLGEVLSGSMGPHNMVAACFRAVEETRRCREALVMGQRQLVDGGLRGLQSRTRATVTLVQRPMWRELVGGWAVPMPRSRCPLGPRMPR